MNRMSFRTRYVLCTGKITHRQLNILELSLILLLASCITYRPQAYACHPSSSILTEVKHQYQAYSAPHDLGLPNRREPGGTR